jgi:hypothetical protein
MNTKYASVWSAILAASILVSCASAPAAKKDTLPVDANASLSSMPESAVAGETDSGSANVDTLNAENAENAKSVSAESDVTGAEQAPLAPAGDRIIRFYPEPETADAVPVPVPPTVSPPTISSAKAAPVAPKPAPTNVPAPKAAEPKSESPAPAETNVPGIWVEEPVAPSVLPAAAAPANPPSRNASVSVGQSLEVWYPGTGWVYLGDASSRNGLAYETRRLDKNDTLFTFKALKEGDYILNFSRFDVLEDDFSADSLAVNVKATVADAGRKTDKVRAPDYRSVAVSAVPGDASAVIPASSVMTDEPSLFGTAPSSIAGTPGSPVSVVQSPASPAPAVADPAVILDKAKAALAAGDPASAIALLDSFFSAAVTSLDEGWYLRGQAYEANSAVRDIRKALDCYQTLVSAYPDSSRWKDADARIRYIQQFYLRIR